MSNIISNTTQNPNQYPNQDRMNLTQLSESLSINRSYCLKIANYLKLITEMSIIKKGSKTTYSFSPKDKESIQQFLQNTPNTRKFFLEQTCLNKYGVTSTNQLPSVKQKRAQTCLEKWGVDNVFKSKQIKDKIKQTCLDKYGVEYSSQNGSSRNKYRKTCLDKYGVDNSFKSEDIKNKIKQTCLDKYGVEYASRSPEIINKVKQTCLEKYGVDNPSKSKNFIKKAKKTKENNIKYIETTYNCTLVENLIRTYGQGWYIYLDISRLHFGGFSYIDNKYIPDIETYNLNNISYGTSNIEKDIITFIREIYNGDILENTRDIIPPQELDVYIPEKKLAIEFNGNYWHSTLIKPKKYHEQKSKLCESKGIRLIHIYECEWNYSQEKIKSLLRLALGVGYSKIGARQCEVKKISNKEAKPFNEANHLQGHRNAQVTYGLFYKNELQQLMSFSHNKKYEWEIIRGCPGSNNQVIGGVSKLFKAFVKEYNPSSVFSYCDFNKFDGKGYEALGMKFIGYTGPDKFYVDKSGVKLSRNPKRHKELEESSKFIIWGSGSKKYLWSKD